MRKKHYEKLALEWVQSYENIVIDTPELSEAAKVKDKTTGRHNKLGGIARGGRVRAALYDLQQAIVNAAARFDTTVALIKGRTSKTCSVCRGRMETENDGDRIVTCKGCGAVVDREQNAAAVVWKEAMGQLEAIRAKSEMRSLEHQEALGKRAVRKKARHAARHRARTNSEQEIAGDSRNS
ncbi:MAG: zinc ribbon domain-containing protein [Nitrospirota bacterium]